MILIGAHLKIAFVSADEVPLSHFPFKRDHLIIKFYRPPKKACHVAFEFALQMITPYSLRLI